MNKLEQVGWTFPKTKYGQETNLGLEPRNLVTDLQVSTIVFYKEEKRDGLVDCNLDLKKAFDHVWD